MPRFNREPVIGPTDHCNGSMSDRRIRCQHDADCLTAYGRSLLDAFRDANPGLVFIGDSNPCFGTVATGSVRRHYPCDGYRFGIGSLLMNQQTAVRVKKNATVYVPQPYYTAAYEAFDGEKATLELATRVANAECLRKRLSGFTLEARYAGAGRSWYHPGSSALWVIGSPEALDTINTDYPLPLLLNRLRSGSRESIQPTPEDFDAPTPCPSWTVKLPDWTCRFVNNRGNVCGRITARDSDQCGRHHTRNWLR